MVNNIFCFYFSLIIKKIYIIVINLFLKFKINILTVNNVETKPEFGRFIFSSEVVDNTEVDTLNLSVVTLNDIYFNIYYHINTFIYLIPI